jgi:acyl-CoA reductase-like NAD-dependent aldehyde dehydrogenase
MGEVEFCATAAGGAVIAKVREDRLHPYHARKTLTDVIKNRYILENQSSISIAACLDSGKTRIDSSFGEILVTVEKLKWTILHGEKSLKSERRPTNLLMCYKVNEVRWEPLGVVAACVSWK